MKMNLFPDVPQDKIVISTRLCISQLVEMCLFQIVQHLQLLTRVVRRQVGGYLEKCLNHPQVITKNISIFGQDQFQSNIQLIFVEKDQELVQNIFEPRFRGETAVQTLTAGPSQKCIQQTQTWCCNKPNTAQKQPVTKTMQSLNI